MHNPFTTQTFSSLNPQSSVILMVDGAYDEIIKDGEGSMSIDTENLSSEAEHNISVNLNDGKADNEKDLRDLVSSVTYSSCVESSESSSIVVFPHFFLHSYPSENVVSFTDKNILECELQESNFCYKENTGQDVKDICVDEGVPTRNQTLWEVDKRKVCTLLPEMDHEKESTKDKVKTDPLVLYALDLSSQKNSGKSDTYLHQFENLVQMVATDTVEDDVGKAMVLTESKTALCGINEEDSRPSVDEDDKNEKKCAKISSEPSIGCTSEESKFNCEETMSGDPDLPSTADVSNSDNIVHDYNNMPGDRGLTSQFSYPVPSSGRDDIQQKSEHKTEEHDCGSIRSTSELANRRYDSRDDSGYLQHDFGESSFTAVRTLSSFINHSSPVAYSGSVSLRSESSTTSTRSFAFPIIQTEWNSSPVRMAKADRRRLRKCRGWREGLLCCRF